MNLIYRTILRVLFFAAVLCAWPDRAAAQAPAEDCDGNGIVDSAEHDEDGDGVIDACDICPNDPTKIFDPFPCGCNAFDRDLDGVCDLEDECPDNPSVSWYSPCGCAPADRDGDGVCDQEDVCPDDPAKTFEYGCGCGVPDTDSDADGVPDCSDACPGSPKSAPGICGCAEVDADSDGDGTLDCRDYCPNDGLKTAPGVCGCGSIEKDTDEDGLADCADECPQDPSKTAPGACGCGSPDLDRDGDGSLDCVDQCPGNPALTQLGVCNCEPIKDSNRNNLPDCLVNQELGYALKRLRNKVARLRSAAYKRGPAWRINEITLIARIREIDRAIQRTAAKSGNNLVLKDDSNLAQLLADLHFSVRAALVVTPRRFPRYARITLAAIRRFERVL